MDVRELAERVAARTGFAATPDGRGGYMVRCPYHDDHEPSLHLWTDNAGEVAFACLAGCDWSALKEKLTELGLPVAAPAAESTRDAHIVATYDYRDEAGSLVYQVVRYQPKGFRQRRPNGNGGWIWNLKGTQRLPFRLPQLIEAVADGKPVHVTEGEKDALAIVAAGAVATCNSGGAGKWRDEYSAHFLGANVIIVADKDEPGRKHAAVVAASLRSAAASVRIVEAEVGKDAHDHLAAGHGLDEFVLVSAEPAASTALPIHSVAELEAMQIPRPEYVVGVPLALARGTVAELDAYPKHGKTRLTLDAVWSLLKGRPFLGAPTTKVKVLYLTEEWLVTWRDALAEAQLTGVDGQGLFWMSLIDLQGREPGDWVEVCEHLRRFCLDNGVGLLVVDTLARWAGVPDENDAVAMAAAVAPLRLIAAENVAVLFLRHDRKGGGELGQSGRGSSAATGEADHILHLQRKAGTGETVLRQRELEGIGRLAGMTGKLVIELGEGGHYEAVGTSSDVALRRAKEVTLGLLPASREEAWTVSELTERVQGSTATVNRALAELCREGHLKREKGAGHAAASRGRKALGYWRPAVQGQERLDLEES